MKVVLFALSVVFLIAAVHGHAQMSIPAPRAPRTESTTKYCGSGTNSTGEVTVRVQAGRRLKIVSQPNTHEGQGNVVIKLLPSVIAAPTADQYNSAPTLVNSVTGGRTLELTAAPSYVQTLLFETSLTSAQVVIPADTPLGPKTLVWEWDGYYSCSEIEVLANDGTFVCSDNKLDCNYIGPGTQIGATAKGGKCNLGTGKCECVNNYSGERCEIAPENSASMGAVSSLLVTLLLVLCYVF